MVSKQKILIVDDDNNISELISLYLTKECFDTMIVNDGEHDDGNGVLCPDLSAHLITINTGKHQIQQNQIRSKGLHSRHHGFSVIDDHGIKTFLRQI